MLSIRYENCVGRLLSVGRDADQIKSRDKAGKMLKPSGGTSEGSWRAMKLDPDTVQLKRSITEEDKGKWKRSLRRRTSSSSSSSASHINNLDDGCLMHIFSFLSPIPDRYNTALVCHRWNYLACHPRLWLRVDRSAKNLSEPGVFPSIETAVSAARPGDTILVAAGGSHRVSNIQIKKPICLIGAGELPDDTMLICSRGSDSALELLSTCKLANLTVKAELGCCLLHRRGRLTIDGCILQCESNPLDYLSCPIVSTFSSREVIPSSMKSNGDGVFVSQTRIEGGAKAVLTCGDLVLQRVRVRNGKICISRKDHSP